jgi:hypothetical protein
MTYAEAGERMGVSSEAVRRRALRGHWARQPGNDGRTRVCVPEGLPDLPASRSPAARPDGAALVRALEGHIETLKADNEQLKVLLAAAEARADKAIAEFTALAQRLAPSTSAQEQNAQRWRWWPWRRAAA